MPKNAEKAAKAKEKKERKLLEQQMKQSKEKVDEAKLLMDPVDPKTQPNFPKAVAALDAAVGLWAGNVEAYRLRGDCYREGKNLDAAIENYTTAITESETDIPSLEGRACCYVAQQKWDAAVADFTKMIAVNPALDHPYNMRAMAKLHKRAPGLRLRNAELAAVIEDFTKAIRLNPNNFHATCNLAGCLDEHGMYLDAIEQYTNALKLKDEYTYAAYRRGLAALAYVEAQKADDVLRDLKKKEAEAEAKREEALRRQELAHEGILDPSRTKRPAVEVHVPTEADIEALLAAERAAEAKAAEEARLLTQAIGDFTRVIPPEEIQTELPCVLHRATCYLHLGQLDKANADLKIATGILDPIKGSDIAETTFGGVPCATLKEILAIRKATHAQLQAKERRMASSVNAPPA